jgi:hypothetical protein
MKSIEILKQWDKQTLNKLVKKLNSDYLVSDEDSIELSSIMIENWSDECDDYLQNSGYTGGKLNSHGEYFNNRGAIYVLFDETKITYESAAEYLNKVANRDV